MSHRTRVSALQSSRCVANGHPEVIYITMEIVDTAEAETRRHQSTGMYSVKDVFGYGLELGDSNHPQEMKNV